MIGGMFILFLVLLLLNVPIAFSLGASSLFYLLTSNMNAAVLAQKFYAGIDSFTLLCIPGFMLAGALLRLDYQGKNNAVREYQRQKDAAEIQQHQFSGQRKIVQDFPRMEALRHFLEEKFYFIFHVFPSPDDADAKRQRFCRPDCLC